MSDGDFPNKARGLVSWRKLFDDLHEDRNAQSNCLKMTPREEKTTAAQDELGDVTTCCICDETYRDPRILPCVHTFCMTCLQLIGTHTRKNPGDPMPCPLCRQEFKIPEDGFAALKKNFFMVRLIEITTAKKDASSLCDIHRHENLCLYCSECYEVVCMVCIRKWHHNHRLSDLNSAADSFRSQLHSNVITAKLCEDHALMKKKCLHDERSAVVEKIQLLETEVRQVSCDLKALIDRHAKSVLQKLESLKMEQLLDIEVEEKVLDKHLKSLKNFEACCNELASNDQHDSSFCKMASKLKKEIVELKQRSESIIERERYSTEIKFTRNLPMALEINKTENVIGTVKAINGYSGRPELIRTIAVNCCTGASDSHAISGMAVSYNDVFVVYENNPVISIYDAYTLKCTTRLTLEGFVREVDLRDCVSVDGYVYIVNAITNEILRIDYNRDFMKWSTGNDTGRLSVSRESTIVATCYETSALKEYSLEGRLIQAIKLCKAIVHPQHAVKLVNGHFVVGHIACGDALGGVCIVDNIGSITKLFRSRLSGSNIHSLFSPICLAVDVNGNVLVLGSDDGSCYGVWVLSPDLEFKREFLSIGDGLRMPLAMHFDEDTNQLYIAEKGWLSFRMRKRYGGRVYVFYTI